MNYAIWLWESSWAPYEREVDAANFRHGPDPRNHEDVETSALIEVIKAYWGRNELRPEAWRMKPDGRWSDRGGPAGGVGGGGT